LPHGKQTGNQTALDLRMQNDEFNNFKVPQELSTLNNSHFGAGYKKSQTRPET
jgi:hypothetical protein